MTTLLLATTGGHLQQLAELARRLDVEPAVWVTHANEQSRSLLAGHDVVYVPYVRPHQALDVMRCLPTAHRLRTERRITRVISTGSGIALGYLPYLAARGVACHYIESAARVAGPSLTGKVLEQVRNVRTYTQYPHWTRGRWAYAGSVFDGYAPLGAPRPLGEVLRVVVTVGTATDYPFPRMIAALVPLLAAGGPLQRAAGVPLEVLWQTGCTPVSGFPITATPFLSADELGTALSAADIVISHAGAGSAIATLAAGRVPMLVDRRARLGEAVDNHQGQLADELVRRGLGVRCEPAALTPDELLAARELRAAAASVPPPLALLPGSGRAGS